MDINTQKRLTIGINLGSYAEGSARSEYVLAHEIVHRLIGQKGIHEQIDNDEVLTEGAATFYGSKAIQKIHPLFDITKDPSFQGDYKQGYEFFKEVASVVDNPLLTINSAPPVKCMVQSPHTGEFYLDDETTHPAKYVERIMKKSPSNKHQEWVWEENAREVLKVELMKRRIKRRG